MRVPQDLRARGPGRGGRRGRRQAMSMGCACLVGALRTRQTRVTSRAAQRGPARRARGARTSGWLRSARRIWLKLSPVSPLRYLTESLSSDRLSVSTVGHARTAAATSATSSHRRKYSTLVRMEGAYTSVWRGCACVVECEWQKGARGGAQASEVGGRKSVCVCVVVVGGGRSRRAAPCKRARARAPGAPAASADARARRAPPPRRARPRKPGRPTPRGNCARAGTPRGCSARPGR